MPVFRRPTILGASRVTGKPRNETKNIVIFGETGVGKSSLINLIADEKIAETSSSAAGCTPNYQRHALTIGGQQFAVWDTAGLDEGTQGTVPAEKAEAYLKQLLRDLAKASGIDLLIYCVRGTRVRSALLANYHLFYSAICRKKVPIAIVVTGLENQEGNMDTWWLKNEKQFLALQMKFDNFACVTTLRPSTENAALMERRRISRTALTNMIMDTCRKERWMPAERDWIDTAFFDIHAMLSPRVGKGARVANVIMCDISRPSPVGPGAMKRGFTFQAPVTLPLFPLQPMNLRSPISVANKRSQMNLPFDDAIKCTPERLFRVYQVPRKQTLSVDKEKGTKKTTVLRRGADLLIFCLKKVGEFDDIRMQWEHFCLTYGADLSPQIVIVIGAPDQRSAEEWWNDAGGATTRSGDVCVTCWPENMTVTQAGEMRRHLRKLINTCCIDCSKVTFAGDKPIFNRSTSPHVDKIRSASLWMRKPTSDRVDAPTADQDALTEWGVWQRG